MPTVPPIDDIFISYGHIDNSDGWVTALHERLRQRISQLLGRDVCIFRDLKLDGKDALWEVLQERASNCRIFLSVLSPRYVRSEACRKEIQWFRAAVGREGIRLGHAFRVIRVVKTPYSEAAIPEELQDIDTTGFPFFERNQQDPARFSEYPAKEGLPGYTDFFEQSENLAQSIAGLLEKIEEASVSAAMATPSRTPPPNAMKRVFVAEVSHDRVADRAFTINELKGRYNVCPATPLTPRLDLLQAELAEALEDCVLSVHIMGANYGLVPELEPTRSLTQIQWDAAAGVRRLVWIPEQLANVEERQKILLAMIEGYDDPNLEVMRSGKDAFLRHLDDVLEELERQPKGGILGKAVYLVSNEDDLVRRELKQLRKCLLDRGLRVDQPVFEGDVDALVQADRDALRSANATLVFYGLAPDTWVKNRRMEIVKVLAEIETAQNHARALYLCSPESKSKRGVYMDLPDQIMNDVPGFPPLMILGDCGDFDCAKIEPLFRNLRVKAP